MNRIDITAKFPRLALYQKRAIRLHPQRVDSVDSLSGFGISPLWPASRPWPVCDSIIYQNNQECRHTEQFLPVLQIFAGDMPDFSMPDGKDLFQLMWCPESHINDYYAPHCKGFWQNSAELGTELTQIPQPVAPDKNYLPQPCILQPEIAQEYPTLWELEELDEELFTQISVWEGELDDLIYQYGHSAADGCKIGGYASWIQDPEVPVCSCGKKMEHLLTIADSEFDGGTARWWGPGQDIFQLPYEERAVVQSPLGISLGDMGKIYIFVCKSCEDWPIESVFQCS